VRLRRRISGPNRVAVAYKIQTLHNEKLHKLRSSQQMVRPITSRRMSGACSTHGEMDFQQIYIFVTMHATCFSNFILPDLITLAILAKEYRH